MTISTRALIENLLARYDEVIRDAFMAAIQDIRSSITLRVIVERLEKGDVEGAMGAMQLDRDAFARLELAIAEAYNCQRRSKTRPLGGAKVGHLALQAGNVGRA